LFFFVFCVGTSLWHVASLIPTRGLWVAREGIPAKNRRLSRWLPSQVGWWPTRFCACAMIPGQPHIVRSSPGSPAPPPHGTSLVKPVPQCAGCEVFLPLAPFFSRVSRSRMKRSAPPAFFRSEAPPLLACSVAYQSNEFVGDFFFVPRRSPPSLNPPQRASLPALPSSKGHRRRFHQLGAVPLPSSSFFISTTPPNLQPQPAPIVTLCCPVYRSLSALPPTQVSSTRAGFPPVSSRSPAVTCCRCLFENCFCLGRHGPFVQSPSSRARLPDS